MSGALWLLWGPALLPCAASQNDGASGHRTSPTQAPCKLISTDTECARHLHSDALGIPILQEPGAKLAFRPESGCKADPAVMPRDLPAPGFVGKGVSDDPSCAHLSRFPGRGSHAPCSAWRLGSGLWPGRGML